MSSNTCIAKMIAAEVVTKPEPVTLEELFSYIKQEASKVKSCFVVIIRFCVLGYL